MGRPGRRGPARRPHRARAAWRYKRNLSPLAGRRRRQPRAGRARHARRAALPATLDWRGAAAARPRRRRPPRPGQLRRPGRRASSSATQDEGWAPFTPFALAARASTGTIPNLRFVDLTGDGLRRRAAHRGRRCSRWYPSLGEDGFGPARASRAPWDEERGPRLVFADGTEAIFLADMSGDGLTDLVRIRNGEVCYWPNLGYGRFGAKVTMDGAPRFDRRRTRFDPRRRPARRHRRLGHHRPPLPRRATACALCFNQSGNAWAAPQPLAGVPGRRRRSARCRRSTCSATAPPAWSGRRRCPADARRAAALRRPDGRRQAAPARPDAQQPRRRDAPAATRRRRASTSPTGAPARRGSPGCRSRCTSSSGSRPSTGSGAAGSSPATRYHHGYFDGVRARVPRLRHGRAVGHRGASRRRRLPERRRTGTRRRGRRRSTRRTWFHTGAFLEARRVSSSSPTSTGSSRPCAAEPAQRPARCRTRDCARRPRRADERARGAAARSKGSAAAPEVYADDGSARTRAPVHGRASTNYDGARVASRCGPNRHAVVLHASARELTLPLRARRRRPAGTHAVTLEVDDFGNVRCARSRSAIRDAPGRRRRGADRRFRRCSPTTRRGCTSWPPSTAYTIADRRRPGRASRRRCRRERDRGRADRRRDAAAAGPASRSASRSPSSTPAWTGVGRRTTRPYEELATADVDGTGAPPATPRAASSSTRRTRLPQRRPDGAAAARPARAAGAARRRRTRSR